MGGFGKYNSVLEAKSDIVLGPLCVSRIYLIQPRLCGSYRKYLTDLYTHFELSTLWLSGSSLTHSMVIKNHSLQATIVIIIFLGKLWTTPYPARCSKFLAFVLFGCLKGFFKLMLASIRLKSHLSENLTLPNNWDLLQMTANKWRRYP